MLTKSTYVMGLSCQKVLWLYYHDKGKLPEPSDADKHRMSQGILVGEMAQDIYPGSYEIFIFENEKPPLFF